MHEGEAWSGVQLDTLYGVFYAPQTHDHAAATLSLSVSAVKVVPLVGILALRVRIGVGLANTVLACTKA